jgi:peptidoglycan/LPS O-acetylase OafA/YrhL
MAKHRFVLLDGLRGLSAVGVVLTHVASHQFPILSGGYLLVDFFFVLSGFVLEPLMPKQGEPFWPQARRFIYKRFLRFWPMVLVVLTFRMSTCLPVVPSTEKHARYCSALFTNDFPLSLVGAALLLQIFMPSAMQFVGPFWSLSAEWLANLVMTPLTALRNRFILPLAVVVGYAVLVGGYLSHRSAHSLFSGPSALGRALVGFVLGLLLRRAHGAKRAWSNPLALGTSVALVGALFVYQRTPYPGTPLIAPLVFAFLVSQVAQVDQTKVHAKILSLSAYLGFISFGMYAWHEDMNYIVQSFLGDDWRQPYAQHSNMSVVLVAAGVLLASAVVTHLTIRFVETPIQRRWGGRFRPDNDNAVTDGRM